MSSGKPLIINERWDYTPHIEDDHPYTHVTRERENEIVVLIKRKSNYVLVTACNKKKNTIAIAIAAKVMVYLLFLPIL